MSSQMVSAAGGSAVAMFGGSTSDLPNMLSQRGSAALAVGSARVESEDSGRIRRMYVARWGLRMYFPCLL
jgi:hypothetical protein